jgi:hypothetical protein
MGMESEGRGQASAEIEAPQNRACGHMGPLVTFLPGDSKTVILKTDDDHAGRDHVTFRLTYEGHLLGSARGNARTKHKHEIRRVFHMQLVRFWRNSAFLSRAKMPDGLRLSERLANNYTRCGYRWVPLVKEGMLCDIHVLFLRSDAPGALVQSGVRIKTLLDALRMPVSVDELGGYTTPSETEDPFFVLLDDDKISLAYRLRQTRCWNRSKGKIRSTLMILVLLLALELEPTMSGLTQETATLCLFQSDGSPLDGRKARES